MKIQRGITRTVFVGKRWTVKFPSLRTYDDGVRGLLWSVCRGILANQSESEWSGTQGYCPVKFSLWGLFNVYPTAQPAYEPIDYDAIADFSSGDRKPQNVGWLDGKLVWVDYDMNFNECRACGRREPETTE